MRYSVIIPVYNRPDEVDELLKSLTTQHFTDFEVIVVEDGSSVSCKEIVDRYTDKLDIKYFLKSNSGPGQSRNYGAERSEGEYLIILDSDVILPSDTTLPPCAPKACTIAYKLYKCSGNGINANRQTFILNSRINAYEQYIKNDRRKTEKTEWGS